MKTGLSLLLLLIATTAFSQTKLIFHKSHSGAAMSFTDAPGYSSNFGAAIQPTVKNAALDSVIFVDDTTAIMVTSEYCSRFNGSNKRPWKAGRDTVYHHELFSQQHALNTIRETLMQQYYFEGDIDSTVFVGYDDDWQQQQQQQNGMTPTNPNRQQRNELYLLLVFVSAVIAFGVSGSVFRWRRAIVGKD